MIQCHDGGDSSVGTEGQTGRGVPQIIRQELYNSLMHYFIILHLCQQPYPASGICIAGTLNDSNKNLSVRLALRGWDLSWWNKGAVEQDGKFSKAKALEFKPHCFCQVYLSTTHIISTTHEKTLLTF